MHSHQLERHRLFILLYWFEDQLHACAWRLSKDFVLAGGPGAFLPQVAAEVDPSTKLPADPEGGLHHPQV